MHKYLLITILNLLQIELEMGEWADIEVTATQLDSYQVKVWLGKNSKINSGS